MATLRIKFTGICAFVQQHKRVVLLDASTPRLSKNNPNVTIPAHFAYVRVNQKNVIDFPLPNKFSHMYERRDPENQGTTTRFATDVCLVKQVGIRVTSTITSPHSLNEEVPVDLERPHPKTAEYKSLHWLAKLGRGLQTADEMDPQYYSDNPSGTVAAYVIIEKARKECSFVPFDRKSSFQPNTSNYRRSFATAVDAVFDITEPQIRLEVKPFSGSGSRTIVLDSTTTGGLVEIVVGNSPLEAILQVAHNHECIQGIPNYDFELFYDLARVKPTMTWPVPICEPIGTPKDLGSENCPPVSTKP